MTATEDQRLKRLQLQEDHIGRALRDSEQSVALRLERLPVGRTL